MTAIAHDILKQNDTDLIKPHQVEGFRHYLVSQKCKTRKGNGKGQFLFVETSAGWAALQRGAGGTVKSPIALRAVIHDYLKSPAARCVSLAQRIAQAAQVPVDAHDLALQLTTPVVAPVAASDWPLEGDQPGQMSAGDNCAGLGQNTGEGSEATSSVQALPLGEPAPAAGCRAENWREFHRLAATAEEALRQCTGSTIILPPRLRELAAKGAIAIVEAPHAIDLQHLEDLRDDFAIHCPLPQLEGEDLGDYADRRWAYADLMISKRFPMSADK
ncbi:hypothetical protein [Pseudomonas putida]|uniref:Uncharacterized protein n=1 Tax=Pseudomonas putida TaxID=303 RepID=A0A1L7NPW1_PSEPU|nr:hypothetical protein [Pseudomonas putida]BAW27508.1 Uncharacterized protein KF715C_pC750 [Pseudomonas putida]